MITRFRRLWGLGSVRAAWNWIRVTIRTVLYRMIGRGWKPHSHMFIVGDGGGWTLSWEARELSDIARGLGISLVSNVDFRRFNDQCMFVFSRYFLLNDDWLQWRNQVALPYYHGMPGTGIVEFDRCYEALRKHHTRLDRIQVTHQTMKDVVLSTGIDPAKVFLIHIGINTRFFPYGDVTLQRAAREILDLPESAFVVGSFLKDGEGWEEGLHPKLIKGPDVLVEALSLAKSRIPELYVLLSGPARGYVKNRLRELGIPFRHVVIRNYPEISHLYHASNVCLVASRQEGGPKAILEAMATGTPIVSTRVGQANDLILHGVNGWLADIDDAEGLARHVIAVYESSGHLDTIRLVGRQTAEENSYNAQLPLWRKFFTGFVEQTGR